MAVKFSNNAKTTLSSGITSSATSIDVVDASAWPTLGSGDHSLCTLITVADPDVLEIVKVTAISGNTLTVVRAQEGTTARAFASADKAELRVTAGLLEQALTGTDVVKLDSLTASATASYSMAVGGVAYSPSNVNALVVSLNGVTQEPTEAFTISGSTLTFASALTSADSIDYIVDLAKTLDIGEPSDNTVSPAKLTSAVNLDAITDNGATTTNAVTLGNLTSTGIDDNATSTAITIDASENVGIGGSPTGSSSYRTLNIIGGADVGGAIRLSTTANENGHVFQYNDGIYLSGDEVTFITTGDPAVSGDVKTAYRVDRTAQLHRWFDPLDGSTERMRIDSSGRVGIGVNNPAEDLEVAGTILASAVAYSSNQDEAYLIAGTAGWTGATTNWNTFGFQHRIKTNGGGVPRITIDNFNGEIFSVYNSGVVVIGGQTPAGGGAGIFGALQARGFGSKAGVNGSQRPNLFNIHWNSGSLEAWVDTTNVGTFSLTSDYRIKRNIESMSEPALERISQLRPVTYQPANFSDLFQESDEVKEGFIAHELQEVIPSAVDGEKDAENQIQSLKVDALCAVLTKAIQEQQAIIEDLQTRISALEAN